MRNGEVSHWMARALPVPEEREERARHEGASTDLPTEVDLVVVGGGLSGLWAAYHALLADPSASVLVLEAEHVGYGASGRNGGWLSTLVPGNREVYARRAGVGPVRSLQRALVDAVGEVLDVLEAEGIDAGQVRGGQLQVARTGAQLARLRAGHAAHLRFGMRDDEVHLLGPAETRERVAVEGLTGGLLVPATARVDPARMVQGLAAVVRRRGAQVVEHTRVTSVAPGLVTTTRGPVRARDVLVCTEAYSAALLGGRSLVPVSSSMVVTEPLPAQTWDRIGWAGRECLSDAAHVFVYAQRTDDDRIAIGGRGTPYAFGSGLPGEGRVDDRTVAVLRDRLAAFFPGLDLPLAHAWRGAIGVTRDWCASVRFDPVTRVGGVQGYAGHGVTATWLAARTLVDRLHGRRTPLTALPWNDHVARDWAPEPLRWLGIHGMYRLFATADRWEESRGSTRTALPARLGSRLAGLHE